MAIIDISTPQNIIDEYNSYDRLYNYNGSAQIPLSPEEFINLFGVLLRPDVVAFKSHKKYVDADFCFRLKNMGYNTKGYALWKENRWAVNYPPKIYTLENPKSNSECKEDEAIIPYYEHDYLKFLYKFNEK